LRLIVYLVDGNNYKDMHKGGAFRSFDRKEVKLTVITSFLFVVDASAADDDDDDDDNDYDDDDGDVINKYDDYDDDSDYE